MSKLKVEIRGDIRRGEVEMKIIQSASLLCKPDYNAITYLENIAFDINGFYRERLYQWNLRRTRMIRVVSDNTKISYFRVERASIARSETVSLMRFKTRASSCPSSPVLFSL